MKILHINTMDEGGAATACRRIHLGLLNKGIDSKTLFLKKKKNIKETYRFEVIKPGYIERILNKIKRLFKTTPTHANMQNVEMLSMPTSSHNIIDNPLYKEADIIQLNWVSTFLDEPSFFKENKKPIVWRMPDLYACGGGNHYEVGFPFNQFENILEENKGIRKKALENTNITFVPISKWVENKADKSELIKTFPKKMIHNGVDFEVFKKLDKNECRRIFNLPLEKIIILIGADRLNVKRKGLDLAIDALTKINLKEITVVVFGNTNCKLPEGFISVGTITDERLLPVLYSASDYFLMSSIEEAFGQVTIEALACGVPAISFPNGGSLDIIKNKFNGVLASDFTSDSLAYAIEFAIKTNFNSISIIKDIQSRFNINDKVEEYIELYNSILTSKN